MIYKKGIVVYQLNGINRKEKGMWNLHSTHWKGQNRQDKVLPFAFTDQR